MAFPGSNPMPSKPVVHVEARVKTDCTVNLNRVRELLTKHCELGIENVTISSTLESWRDVQDLARLLERVVIDDWSSRLHRTCAPMSGQSMLAGTVLKPHQVTFQVHVYPAHQADAFEEYTEPGAEANESVMAATVTELPSYGIEGLWESLIYPDDVKVMLLDYIYSTIVFSDAGVDFSVVSWNRVVLLHGPPGTGKTSLCRALAQKLAIRMKLKYSRTQLLEINSHSLFSRWFSESGKLVQRLFGSVMGMIEEESSFVVVLIDEVESLTAARAGAMAGNEPSDALRVVNALLTQLDKLKSRKNVLVLSTSNLPQAIDSAFVDRADIVQFIDLPPPEAIYGILRSCLLELMSKGIIVSSMIPSAQQALFLRTLAANKLTAEIDESVKAEDGVRVPPSADRVADVAAALLGLAGLCRNQSMSGRSLRRLPVLAHARYIAQEHSTSGICDVVFWLDAMERVVRDQKDQAAKLNMTAMS